MVDLYFQSLTDTINAVALKDLSALPVQCANPLRHAQWAMLAGLTLLLSVSATLAGLFARSILRQLCGEPDCARAVEQGTTQVDRAGATMSEVVAAVQRMTDTMAEISAAGVERNAGVAQVGSSVSQMDRATPQNAALVEQSAAAAESLRD